jgi:hypothetical protein
MPVDHRIPRRIPEQCSDLLRIDHATCSLITERVYEPSCCGIGDRHPHDPRSDLGGAERSRHRRGRTNRGLHLPRRFPPQLLSPSLGIGQIRRNARVRTTCVARRCTSVRRCAVRACRRRASR